MQIMNYFLPVGGDQGHPLGDDAVAVPVYEKEDEEGKKTCKPHLCNVFRR